MPQLLRLYSTSSNMTVSASMKRYGLRGHPCRMPDPTVPLQVAPNEPSVERGFLVNGLDDRKGF